MLREIINKDGYSISDKALETFANKCASNIDIALSEFEKLKTIKLSKNILDKTFDLILKLLQSKFEIRLKSIF